jgi:pectate lyase
MTPELLDRYKHLFGYAAGTTGGLGGRTVNCATGDEVQAAINAKGEEPLIINLTGAISGANTKAAQIDISGKRDITLMADGEGQDFSGVGIRINKASSNIILFNLKGGQISEGGKDCIGIEGDCHHIVGLHLDLSGDMSKGKDYYDGLADTKRGSHSIAFVLCKFSNHHKACLNGYSDKDSENADRKLTFALCWWDNCGSRCPSVRYGEAHVWGCLLTDIETSGVNCRMGAQVLIEATTFDKVHNPICALDSAKPGFWNIVDCAAPNCTWGKPSANEPLAVDMKPTCDFRPPYTMPAITRARAAGLVQEAAGLLPPGKVVALPGASDQPAPEQPQQSVEEPPAAEPDPVEQPGGPETPAEPEQPAPVETEEPAEAEALLDKAEDALMNLRVILAKLAAEPHETQPPVSDPAGLLALIDGATTALEKLPETKPRKNALDYMRKSRDQAEKALRG